jgi:hypothetical protein
MYYTIYQTTCLTSGWIYIGKHQTKDLDDGYLGSGKLLLKAVEHYGKENFSKEILHIFETEEEMNTKEVELVTEDFCSQPGNFNLCPGGQGGWGFINSNNLVDHKKIGRLGYEGSIKKYGTHHMNLEKNKILAGEQLKRLHKEGKFTYGHFKGKSHTQEWKQNHSDHMKEQAKGSGNSQFGTMWITNGTENKKIKKTDSIPEGYRKGRKIKV